jgi:hypothetical protein
VSSDDPRNITVLADAEEADEKLQGLMAGVWTGAAMKQHDSLFFFVQRVASA